MRVRLLVDGDVLNKGQVVDVVDEGEDSQGCYYYVAVPGTGKFDKDFGWTGKTERFFADQVRRVKVI